jgi:hypothetical protein
VLLDIYSIALLDGRSTVCDQNCRTQNPYLQPVKERLCGEQVTDSGASEDDIQLK